MIAILPISHLCTIRVLNYVNLQNAERSIFIYVFFSKGFFFLLIPILQFALLLDGVADPGPILDLKKSGSDHKKNLGLEFETDRIISTFWRLSGQGIPSISDYVPNHPLPPTRPGPPLEPWTKLGPLEINPGTYSDQNCLRGPTLRGDIAVSNPFATIVSW